MVDISVTCEHIWSQFSIIGSEIVISFWGQGKNLLSPICWKAPVCVSLFFSNLVCTFFVKWILFFLKRVHVVRITPLDKKTLQYQWNTATSGQKPGKQVKQTCSKVCFLNIKKTNSSAPKHLHRSTFWYPVFQAFLSGSKRMYGRAFRMIQIVFCNADPSLGSLAVVKAST